MDFVKNCLRMSFSHLSLVLYVCLMFGTSLVYSLYFNLGETEKKCFIEDVPDDTMIVGKYVDESISYLDIQSVLFVY